MRVPYCSYLSEKHRRLSCRDVEPMPSVEVVKEAFRSIRVSMGCTSQVAWGGATNKELQIAHGGGNSYNTRDLPTLFSDDTAPHQHEENISHSFLTTSLYPRPNNGPGHPHTSSSAFTSPPPPPLIQSPRSTLSPLRGRHTRSPAAFTTTTPKASHTTGGRYHTCCDACCHNS